MDRIDLTIRVGALTPAERLMPAKSESSSQIRTRVEEARTLQRKRFRGTTVQVNARIPGGHIDEYIELHPSARDALQKVGEHVPELTTRSYDKLLKVSRTVADLNGSAIVYKKHIEEAADLFGNDKIKAFLQAQSDLQVCASCDTDVPDNARFCSHCGTSVRQTQSVTDDSTSSSVSAT